MPRSSEILLRFGAIVIPVILVAGAARRALKPAPDAPAVAAGIPTAEELDSLSKYLKVSPAQGIPELATAARVQPDLFDPFASADFVQIEEPGPAGPVPQVRDRYVVTAILISRNKRVAVIDDALVGVGSVLPGGVRVVGIESNHVAIVGPSGTRRMLTLKD